MPQSMMLSGGPAACGPQGQRPGLGLIIHAALMLLVAAAGTAEACSPMGDEPVTLPEKAHYHPGVLYGKVVERIEDPRYQHLGNAYTARLEVYCVIKGPATPSVVSILYAGVVHGRCFNPVNLEVGQEYIVFIGVAEGDIRPYDIPSDATTENLNKVSSACGLAPHLPEDPRGSKTCPVAAAADSCEADYRGTPPPPVEVDVQPDHGGDQHYNHVEHEPEHELDPEHEHNAGDENHADKDDSENAIGEAESAVGGSATTPGLHILATLICALVLLLL